MIKHAGHHALCLHSGDAALAYLSHGDLPDLVILDVMMPGTDGMEVLRQVRQDPRTRDLPVVMFSALGEEESQRRALHQGANDYWVKSRFDFGELKERLESHLCKDDYSN